MQNLKPLIRLSVSVFISVGLMSENAYALELPSCLNNKTGVWRIVPSIKKCNAKKETGVLLNSIGQPGSPGQQGAKGEKGDKGDQGDPGSSAGIGVYDANNRFLGTFVKEYEYFDGNSLFKYGEYEIFMPSPINAIARISVGSGEIIDVYNSEQGTFPKIFTGHLYTYEGKNFTGTSCDGKQVDPVYSPQGQSAPRLLKGVGSATSKYFIQKAKSDRGPVTIKSRSIGGECYDYPNNGIVAYSQPLTLELTEVNLILPLPAAPPLRLEYSQNP